MPLHPPDMFEIAIRFSLIAVTLRSHADGSALCLASGPHLLIYPVVFGYQSCTHIAAQHASLNSSEFCVHLINDRVSRDR